MAADVRPGSRSGASTAVSGRDRCSETAETPKAGFGSLQLAELRSQLPLVSRSASLRNLDWLCPGAEESAASEPDVVQCVAMST